MRCMVLFKDPATGAETEVNARHIDEIIEEFGLSEAQGDSLEKKLRSGLQTALPAKGFSAVWRDYEPIIMQGVR